MARPAQAPLKTPAKGASASDLRRLIGDMQPRRLCQVKIPEALEEIDALTAELDAAFSQVLNVADALAGVSAGDLAETLWNCAQANDIAGQRLRKVHEIVSDLGARLNRLQDAGALADAEQVSTAEERRRSALLLNGPAALAGAVSQDFVDSIFD